MQIEGDAHNVTDDDERTRALALYTAKFPFVNEKFAALIAESVIFVLRPHWLRWIDNTRRFGYKQEFRLDDGESTQDES